MFEKDFVYPELSQADFFFFRFLGPGLGNLLFPWARAVCYAKEHDLQLIWPTWPQVKIGPILRREPDLRLYSDLFVRPDHYLGGMKKVVLLSTLPIVREETCAGLNAHRQGLRPRVIRFSGMTGMFSRLAGRNRVLREELLAMTRPQHKLALGVDFSRSISVHVRLGDFNLADPAALRAGKSNTRIPLDWYVDTIKCLRSELGEEWPVHVFSDGSDDQLSELLGVPNVKRLTFNSAISDMIALSRANVLISSASTFSMWASFLGSMPTIWFPGQLKQRLHDGEAGLEVERDFGHAFSAGFVEALSADRQKAF